jgi:hypothetical protein
VRQFDRLNGELGEGFFHVLRDGLVEIYKFSSAFGIEGAIEDLLNRKLGKVVSRKKKSLFRK